jgi:trk system potassium uptake protein TrkA
MNIVISGDGEVGLHLAKLLSDENHNITLITPNKDLLKLIESHSDLMTIIGDSTSFSVLKDVNIKNADLLISVSKNELTNIVTSILSKKIGAKKTIARVNNTEYLTAKSKELFKTLGIDFLVCPEHFASNEIIKLLNQTAATEAFDFSGGKLSLFLVKLEKDAPVINKTLNQIAKEYPHLDFRAVAINRKKTTIIPRGDDMFLENDSIYVITKPNGIDRILEMAGKTRIKIKNAVIVGGGKIGRITAKKLEEKLNIKLIEINKGKCEYLTNCLDKTLIINGDARDIELLEDEDIREMDAFIALTGNSETNILTCLLAKKYGIKKTIALVENIDYIDIAKNMGINNIINRKLITASYIVRFTMNAEVSSSKCLNEIDADVLEFVVKHNSPITKHPISELKFPKGAIIGGIIRGGQSRIAVGNIQIMENDKVVVFALPNTINKVERFFN